MTKPLSRMELAIIAELRGSSENGKRGARPTYQAALMSTHSISHGKGRYYACESLVERGLAECVSQTDEPGEKTLEIRLTKSGMAVDPQAERARPVRSAAGAHLPKSPPPQIEPSWEYIVHKHARKCGATAEQIAEQAGLPSSTVRAFIGNNAILSFRQGCRIAMALGFTIASPRDKTFTKKKAPATGSVSKAGTRKKKATAKSTRRQ